jgi:putative membrane protein
MILASSNRENAGLSPLNGPPILIESCNVDEYHIPQKDPPVDKIDKLVFRIALGFVLVGLLLAIASTQRTNAGTKESASAGKTPSTISSIDQQFVRRVAVNALMDVELGKLATKKALSNDVRKYGEQMVDDHSKASDHLRQLAAKKGMTVAPKLPNSALSTRNRLNRFLGDQFDAAYIDEMLRDHKQDVEDFRRESKLTHDPDIRGFVTETLPILEGHLKIAEAIAPDVKAQRSALQKPSAAKLKLR